MRKKKKIEPKFKYHDLVRVAHIRNMSSKGDTTNWSYKLYENTENVNDTIPSYRIDDLQETYIEALLKKTKLSMKENDSLMRNLNITWINSNCRCPSLLTDTNLFVNTKANPFTLFGKTPSNINSI